jgi:hypothetical protein
MAEPFAPELLDLQLQMGDQRPIVSCAGSQACRFGGYSGSVHTRHGQVVVARQQPPLGSLAKTDTSRPISHRQVINLIHALYRMVEGAAPPLAPRPGWAARPADPLSPQGMILATGPSQGRADAIRKPLRSKT